MTCETIQTALAAPCRHRGLRGFGNKAVCALQQAARSSQRFGGMKETWGLQVRVKGFSLPISESVRNTYHPLTTRTEEQEVCCGRYNHTATKWTWLGTFGLLPARIDGNWQHCGTRPNENYADWFQTRCFRLGQPLGQVAQFRHKRLRHPVDLLLT
jgi:hypothetical protein